MLIPFLRYADECEGKSCGEGCSEGVCDRDGYCVSPEMNPCAVHGCDGKECGETCLMGDMLGACNADGDCDFDLSAINCGNLFQN